MWVIPCCTREERFENGRFWELEPLRIGLVSWKKLCVPVTRSLTEKFVDEIEIWLKTCLAQDAPEEGRGMARKIISFR